MLTKKQREFRDEESAKAAIRMAVEHGKKVGIGVDDMPRVEKTLARVERIATARELAFETEKTEVGAHVRFGEGEVYVFAADKLIPPSERSN